MKKCRLSLLMSAVVAMAALNTPLIQASACYLKQEELFEKYSEKYKVEWNDSLQSYRAVLLDSEDEEFILYDEDGNLIDSVSADYAAYSDNAYRKIYRDTGKIEYDCSYADGFYYAVLPDNTVTIAGADYDELNTVSPTAILIPEEIDGKRVVRIEPFAFTEAYRFMPELNEIHIADSVKWIGNSAFYKAFGIWNHDAVINIPDKAQYIGCNAYGESAFALGNQIVLPESTEFINNYAFGQKHPIIKMPKSLVFTGYIKIDGSHRIITQKTELTEKEAAEMYVDGKYNIVTLYDAMQYYTSKPQPYQSVTVQKMGDVNMDGTVDVCDAVLLSRFCAEDSEAVITDEGKALADVNGDGNIDLNDTTAILQKIAKLS